MYKCVKALQTYTALLYCVVLAEYQGEYYP